MYAIWRACERLQIRPEDVKEKWEDNNVMTQAAIIAYSHIRDYEEAEMASALVGSGLL